MTNIIDVWNLKRINHLEKGRYNLTFALYICVCEWCVKFVMHITSYDSPYQTGVELTYRL